MAPGVFANNLTLQPMNCRVKVRMFTRTPPSVAVLIQHQVWNSNNFKWIPCLQIFYLYTWAVEQQINRTDSKNRYDVEKIIYEDNTSESLLRKVPSFLAAPIPPGVMSRLSFIMLNAMVKCFIQLVKSTPVKPSSANLVKHERDVSWSPCEVTEGWNT